MIRGAALTLAAVATLAGIGAAAADDLSLLNWASIEPLLPATTGMFPNPPDGWNDLPVQFHIAESVGYNSNVGNAPTSFSSTNTIFNNSFKPIGSLVSLSSFGISFTSNQDANQFFGSVSAGMNRYLQDPVLNSINQSASISDRYRTSKCVGTLNLSEETSPSQPGQQIGINYVNSTTTVAASASANCTLNSNYSTTLSAGLSSSTNSSSGAFFNNTSNNTINLDQTSDYQSAFVTAGINYAVSETNTLGLTATMSGNNYNNRGQALNAFGLVNKITTDSLSATYTRTFSPNFSMSVQFGILGAVANDFFSSRVPTAYQPQYSLTAQWSPTPKLSFSAAVSRSASTPTSILSNLQVSESGSASVNYQWTPKVAVGASVSTSYSFGALTPQETGQVFGFFSSAQRSYAASAHLGYSITPFLAANLSYSYYRTMQLYATTNTSVILLAFNFNPH
jgi:hypothetical protein